MRRTALKQDMTVLGLISEVNLQVNILNVTMTWSRSSQFQGQVHIYV